MSKSKSPKLVKKTIEKKNRGKLTRKQKPVDDEVEEESPEVEEPETVEPKESAMSSEEGEEEAAGTSGDDDVFMEDDQEDEEEEVEEEDEDEEGETEDEEEQAEEEEGIEESKEYVDPEELQRKSGVLYFSYIPPKFNPARLRSYFEKRVPGKIGRVYFEKNKNGGRDPDNRYKEGWLEIKSRKAAKFIESTVDGTEIGGKRRDPVSSLIWNIKYLSGFKWIHLTEQLAYEKVAHTQRMNLEVSQARRVAAHFEDMVHKGKHIAMLEQKVLESGGKWESYSRTIHQKKPKKKAVVAKDEEVMKMIFRE